MSIVTKKGDSGFTCLPSVKNNTRSNRQIQKDDPAVECLGALDELDAFLALDEIALTSNGNSAFAGIIAEIRKELSAAVMPLSAQSASACKTAAEKTTEKIALNTARLEQWITNLEKENPVCDFVQTWTNPAAAHLNAARTICRRAERRMVTAIAKNAAAFDSKAEKPKAALLPWINRLSDLLFMAAVSEERRLEPV